MRRLLYFLVLVLLLASGKASAQAQEPNVDLSSAPLYDAEPSIAIDPSDPNHLVAAWMSVTNLRIAIHTKTSTDGGNTWSSMQSLPHVQPSYQSADPSVVIDTKGEAFICYVDYRVDTAVSGEVVVCRSGDGGITWELPVKVRSAAETNDIAIDRPWLIVDNFPGSFFSTLYVTSKPYMTNTNPNHLHVKRSTDGGQTWGADIRVDDSTFAPAIEQSMGVGGVGSDRKLYLAYASYDLAVSPYVRLVSATSTDGGETFTRHEIAKVMNTERDSNWQYGYAMSVNPNSSGSAVVTWIDSRYGDPDVLSSSTIDGGNTWSTPIRVNDDPAGNGAGQDMVWCGFSKVGKFVVAWRDRRGFGTGAETRFNIFGSTSNDGGVSFSPNVQLSDTASNFVSLTKGNDFLAVVAGDFFMHTVWGNYTTNWEVYYDKHLIQSLSVPDSRSLLIDDLTVLSTTPNPAHSAVRISFSLARSVLVGLSVLRPDGTMIQTVSPKQYGSGFDQIDLDLAGFASGAYFCELFAGHERHQVKIIVQH